MSPESKEVSALFAYTLIQLKNLSYNFNPPGRGKRFYSLSYFKLLIYSFIYSWPYHVLNIFNMAGTVRGRGGYR